MTGLIYVIIIALWAAVLIPIWLRRHDQISEVRSTARFQSAMSTLGRKNSHRATAASVAQRRRAIVLGVLTMTLATTLILGLLNMAPIWLAVVSALLVGAYLVAAALTANQRGASRTAARRITRAVRETQYLTEEVVEVDETVVEQPAARKRRFASLAEDEEFAKWDAWEEDDAWEAIPQTLPTYVGAPRASAVPRQIDNDHDGAWTGSDMVRLAQDSRSLHTEEVIVDHRATTAEIPVVQPRRAVNE
jgi:hypothetical protein